MDIQYHHHLSLKDKEIHFNPKEDINNFQKRGSFEHNKILNLQKLNFKRRPVASIKSRHSSAADIKSPLNEDLSNTPKYIHDKVKQYELHPFRKPNLKIVGKDIQYRIYEMNEEDNIEEEKKSEIKTENKENIGFTAILNDIPEKNININQIIKDKKAEERSSLLKEKNKERGSISGTEIDLKIIKKKKTKKKKKLDLNSKLNKFRKLNRIKNLYDSNDDDESEEEKVDDYVINPETKIIRIYDFLIIVFFLYHFNHSTISLCQERCFCPPNKKITFSDVLLFMNDILCIIDLFISFFRAYYNFEYKLIKSYHLILIHFLKYDFVFDLLSAIPIYSISKYVCLNGNYIQCFKYDMPGNFIFLKLCSVLKSLKIHKIVNHKKNQAMEKFFELISDSYTVEKAVNILMHTLIYIGILHCFVCIHIFLGNNSYSNWLILTQALDEPFYDKYIKSLYFIVTSLTTVGYGDIVCKSMIERVYQIIILAIGSIFYPYLISTIGNFINKDSNATIKKDKDLLMLEKIRKDYPNISFKLYNNIYKYIESKSNCLEKYDTNTFIESLPFSLKNNILFTMYQSPITNFKFFKKNNNSVFIAEVLNNFIPSVSKKNEFLIYEGEMVEEMIFLKDGKISLNAAINTEDPTTSINKYFMENFSPFTTEEERKLINENMNNKSYISTLGEITYDKAKSKLNNVFKTIRNEKNTEDKNHFQIQINDDKNDLYDFDVKGGAIINDEGNYTYLKILDIRKNEHFGCVFMTLKKPCPLSLQVKSKIAELFLLKKEQALNLSKSYPNIWRKLYEKEFHNLRSIKKQTFTLLKKYIEVNELFFNNNIDDIFNTNDITIADLNFLEKSILGERSIKHSLYQKSSTRKQEMNKNNTMNLETDNKNKKLNMDAIRMNLKAKIKKHAGVRRNSTFTGYKIQLLPNKSFAQTNSNELNSLANPSGVKKDDVNNDNIIKTTQKSNREKLKNLKDFLINTKRYLNNKQPNNKEINFPQKSSLSSKKNNLIKKIQQDEDNSSNNNKIDAIKDNNTNNTNITPFKKRVEFNLSPTKDNNSYRFPNREKILKDLKDICEDETNFSFCSINKENNYKLEKLTIDRNSNFEIMSSYSNLNKISKGNYINDFNFQKKLKLLIKNYYLHKHKESDFKESLSLKTIAFSSGIESKSKSKIISHNFDTKVLNNKSVDKKKKIEKYHSFHIPNKFNRMKNRKKLNEKIMNKTSIKHRKSVFSENVFNNTIRNTKNNNLDIFATFKMQNQNILEEPRNEIFDTNSIKVNKSRTSSFSKKSLIKKINSSYSSNNSKKVNINSNKEFEYIIDNGINKKINDDNIIINNNSYVNNNHKIYKNRKNRYYNNNEQIYHGRNSHIINQMLGINIPNSNIITNNIITTSGNINDPKDNFNSVEKLKNETSFNIYNIIQKNINKNLNIIDNKDNISPRKLDRTFCSIF